MRDFESSYPFVQHLRAEHDHIRQVLRRIHNSLHDLPEAKTEPAARNAELVASLGELKQELARHLAEEEAGGYLEEAVCRCPQLYSKADDLRKQQCGLVAAVDQLLALAGTPSANSPIPVELPSRFADFTQRLLAHEAGECKVLEHGLAICSEDRDEP